MARTVRRPWDGAGAARWARIALGMVLAWAALPWMGAPVLAQGSGPVSTTPSTVYIPRTGQTIDRLFLDYWRQGGGRAAFGHPITPELAEGAGRVVQYFEFARLEYRPGPDGGGDGAAVGLGRIGAELAPRSAGRGGRHGRETRGGGEGNRAIEARAWERLSTRRAARVGLARADYRFIEESGHGVAGALRAFWEAPGAAEALGLPMTEAYEVGQTTYQVFERGKLGWRDGEAVAREPVGSILAERYGLPTEPTRRRGIPVYDEALFVAPPAVPAPVAAPAVPTDGGRSLVVSLGQQAMWAFDNGAVVRTAYVSTGTERFATPTGQFFVNTKIDAQTMEGVLDGEYYNVPDVPYVMYFTDRGHAIHGTYWHDNFGQPMSHGCVNLPMEVAAWLYGWAPVGLPVVIVA